MAAPSWLQPTRDFAREWQESIIGVLGFVAVIVSLLASSNAERKLQSRLRTADANAVRLTLRSELNLVISKFSGIEQQERNLPANTEGVFDFSPRDVLFRGVLDKFGYLTPEEIETVASAYAEQTRWVPVIQSVMKPLPNAPGFFIVPDQDKTVMTSICHNIVVRASYAISEINRHLKPDYR